MISLNAPMSADKAVFYFTFFNQPDKERSRHIEYVRSLLSGKHLTDGYKGYGIPTANMPKQIH